MDGLDLGHVVTGNESSLACAVDLRLPPVTVALVRDDEMVTFPERKVVLCSCIVVIECNIEVILVNGERGTGGYGWERNRGFGTSRHLAGARVIAGRVDAGVVIYVFVSGYVATAAHTHVVCRPILLCRGSTTAHDGFASSNVSVGKKFFFFFFLKKEIKKLGRYARKKALARVQIERLDSISKTNNFGEH